MGEKTEIKAVELVRSIRDQQAELLAGKSNEEIIEFFRKAGDTARRAANPPPHSRETANVRLQADTR
jgi:hypothetical protein